MGSYTAMEAILALPVALLTANEVRGIMAARIAGRSRNLSRLLSHVVMLLLLGPWVGYSFYWVEVMEAPGVTIETFGSSALNLPYLLLGVGLIVIATWEILALYRARRAGATTNVSRLVSHIVIVALVVAMVSLSLVKWNEFTDRERSEPKPQVSSSLSAGSGR